MNVKKRIVNVKKLLNSKWTAVIPLNKEKHFIVIKVLTPALANEPIEMIEIEAVYSKRCQLIAWQQLYDNAIWQQGWC
ncbi:MAG: hypothetical protein RIS87_658 [Pseudomonadota bacterium]|jgi:tryptophan-rich hypothetical protein